MPDPQISAWAGFPCQVYELLRVLINGGPVADENDIIVTDASKDKCGGRLSSCKLRFGENNPLPYGSFPAAGLLRS
ncbi:hypothetical protein BME99_10860 [Pseudomonas protegens]|nr:hypothetical protein BME99_10860 [Pseudomonas protegens]